MIGRQSSRSSSDRWHRAATTAGTRSWWLAAFWVAAAAAVGLGVVYWRGGQPQAEGVLLAVGAGGLAVGMITWAHRLAASGAGGGGAGATSRRLGRRRASSMPISSRGGVITRRRLILRSLGAAAVAFGAALLFPFRSLGPRPNDAELDASPWAPGLRVVTADGDTGAGRRRAARGAGDRVSRRGPSTPRRGRRCWFGSTPA